MMLKMLVSVVLILCWARVRSEGITAYSDFAEVNNPEVNRNVKTYVLTRKVPVPYPVTVEKRVPVPFKVPVRRPYTVFVPKPYLVEMTRPIPYAVKIPVPAPFAVEKRVPVPFHIPYDKPVPVPVVKPYPVFFEKKVAVPIEKTVPYPFKLSYDRPYSVQFKHSYGPDKKPIEIKPDGSEQLYETPDQQYHHQVKTSQDNEEQTPITEGKHKVITFLPGSKPSSELGTIHVSDSGINWASQPPSEPYQYVTPDTINNIRDGDSFNVKSEPGKMEYRLMFDPKKKEYSFQYLPEKQSETYHTIQSHEHPTYQNQNELQQQPQAKDSYSQYQPHSHQITITGSDHREHSNDFQPAEIQIRHPGQVHSVPITQVDFKTAHPSYEYHSDQPTSNQQSPISSINFQRFEPSDVIRSPYKTQKTSYKFSEQAQSFKEPEVTHSTILETASNQVTEVTEKYTSVATAAASAPVPQIVFYHPQEVEPTSTQTTPTEATRRSETTSTTPKPCTTNGNRGRRTRRKLVRKHVSNSTQTKQ